MARCQGSSSACQHLAPAVATAITLAERTGERLAIHASELVVQSRVPVLRRYRRPLLRCLECTHQPALEDHVSRPSHLGCHRSDNLRIGIRTGIVFTKTLSIFAFQEFGPFSCLQSRVHEAWVRFFASSMKDD